MQKKYAQKSHKKFIIVLLIGIAAALTIWFLRVREAEPGKYDAFAECLAEKKVTMYGAYWCPHCQNQKKMFGSSFSHVPYVECASPGSSAQNKVCTDAGVKGYPTWVFADGSRKEGEVSLEALAEKTGCPLTEKIQNPKP